ncbi:sarcosine oxidase subunit gamma [Paracoccus sp. (in: a-proteobacteria)]|uniref:sarcosine oxidase subunit gamma n=1 Tax=Paracoccus sp. TaxID=267 RepID=UPI0026DF6266|nr:sarcosine oxidase subunit gamma [Paracoccus sp. (in: a-proteobacteria)]MDO5369349.1 sarcosine oxidase subunit gamma [Paracoccus sp. (in: a-proteobacteria)]
MPDRVPDLSPLCATGGSAPAEARHGALSVRENPELALASVARRGDAPEPSPFGLSLPGPGGWTASGDVSAFWTGPDQWMVEGHGLADTDFAARVAADCPDASVTEQTDGFVAFEIRSAKGERPITDLLAKLVNLDPLRLQPGSAARTGLEHLGVFVIRRAPDGLAVIGMRSAAGSLWHALETAISRQVEVAA